MYFREALQSNGSYFAGGFPRFSHSRCISFWYSKENGDTKVDNLAVEGGGLQYENRLV
jgi:hypothetical protein